MDLLKEWRGIGTGLVLQPIYSLIFPYPTTGVASPLLSGLPFSTTVSFTLPFKSGMSNVLLLPPLSGCHLQNPPSDAPLSVPIGPLLPLNGHPSAPTHGCTFQPNSRVTFPLPANLPEISVIWYFDFAFRKLNMPGVPSSVSQPWGSFSCLLAVVLTFGEDERFWDFFFASIADRSRKREKVFALVEK